MIQWAVDLVKMYFFFNATFTVIVCDLIMDAVISVCCSVTNILYDLIVYMNMIEIGKYYKFHIHFITCILNDI